jgi:hypothetical protein
MALNGGNPTTAVETSDGAFSRAYQAARRIGYRAKVELRVLQQVGVRGLIKSVQRSSADWYKQLPVQSIDTFDISSFVPPGTREITEALFKFDAPLPSGGHTVYLPPARFSKGPLAALARRYPADAGIKIMRMAGSASERFAAAGSGHSQLHKALLSSHRGLLLVANRLFTEGVGSRVYDLVELASGDARWTAYVVANASEPGSVSEGTAVVERLKQLVANQSLSLVAPEGFGHSDFLPPQFGNNVWKDASGRPAFVDFQNFQVTNYDGYLKDIARKAATDTHFGDRSLIRGGTYLYQEVPGLGAAGKRGIADRMVVLDDLAKRAGLEYKGRVVLDFGCNIGMMMAEYLRRGASWCVGWDMPTTVQHTERLLLAVGCTRFSLVGGLLGPTVPVAHAVPGFLKEAVKDCVISYLAVRGHMGFLDDLAKLPWQFMLYEGHENDTAEQTRGYLSELAGKVPFKVAAESIYKDGDSRERYVAILRRE